MDEQKVHLWPADDDIRCSEEAAEAKPEPLAGRDMAGLYAPGLQDMICRSTDQDLPNYQYA